MSGWRRGVAAAAAGAAAVLAAACQTPPSHEQWVTEQLDAVVAAQAPECGAVRVYRRAQRLEYRVVCQSGAVYRVRVQADGRVKVTEEEANSAPTPR